MPKEVLLFRFFPLIALISIGTIYCLTKYLLDVTFHFVTRNDDSEIARKKINQMESQASKIGLALGFSCLIFFFTKFYLKPVVEYIDVGDMGTLIICLPMGLLGAAIMIWILRL